MSICRLAFDLLADLVLNPRFDAEDIEKEKGVILEELKMEVDNPEYLVHETFFSKFWKNHSLGRSILGTKATIEQLRSGDDSRLLRRGLYSVEYRDHGRRASAHSRIVEFASRNTSAIFRRLPVCRREVAVAAIAADPQKQAIARAGASVHGCAGLPDRGRTALRTYLLSTILGGGMSSRLFQNVREKHGLAYSVFSELNLYRDSGCLAVYAGTSPENLKKVILMVVDEFRQMCNEAVPAEELRRAKDHLKGSLALSLESTSARMSNLARQELFFGRFQSVDEMMEGIERSTAAQVRRSPTISSLGKQVGVTTGARLRDVNSRRQN